MHTLSTLLYTHMHAHTYQATLTLHTHTNQGCTEPGAEPPTYTLATSSPTPTHIHTTYLHTHAHMHTCTHNKHYHCNGFPQAPVSHQSVTASQLLEHLHAIYYSKILKHTHTHTHTQQPLCTHFTLYILHLHAHTNQGCTEPEAEPPTYTLATCSPIPTHTCIHTQ